MNVYEKTLNRFGWKIEFPIGKFPDKCIVCVAPHTSNWDFIIGEFVVRALNEKARFLIKKSWTVFPLSLIFNPMGAIAVDRSRSMSVTEQVVQLFNEQKKLIVAITPEGTRKRNPEWKRGFYHIAHKAGVPIVPASIDYAKKMVRIAKVFMPTGDVNKDMAEIQRYFKGVSGKFPEQFAIK